MTSYDLALKDAYNSSNENLLTLGRTTTANSSSHDWRPLSTMRVRHLPLYQLQFIFLLCEKGQGF